MSRDVISAPFVDCASTSLLSASRPRFLLRTSYDRAVSSRCALRAERTFKVLERSPPPVLHRLAQSVPLSSRSRPLLGRLCPVTLQPVQAFLFFLFLLQLLSFPLVGVLALNFGRCRVVSCGRGRSLGRGRPTGRRGLREVGVGAGQQGKPVQ